VGHGINGATQHRGSQSAFSGIVFNLLPKAQGQLRPKSLCCSEALRDLTISILMSKWQLWASNPDTNWRQAAKMCMNILVWHSSNDSMKTSRCVPAPSLGRVIEKRVVRHIDLQGPLLSLAMTEGWRPTFGKHASSCDSR
jgi:hypothetical protein